MHSTHIVLIGLVLMFLAPAALAVPVPNIQIGVEETE